MNEPLEVPTRQGYDRWSEIYDDEDNPLIVLEHGLFQQLMADVRGLRILDAGCGTGRHALALASHGAKVTAIDFSEGMLNKSRAKPGAEAVEFRQHDLAHPLPFPDRSFDRVISGLVIDHIGDLRGCFSELRRVCDPAGFALITVMHPAMTFLGAQARFTDPETGILTLPASSTHMMSDYVTAVIQAGLAIRAMQEFVVDEKLVARSERARRYLGWPMLLTMELTP